MKTKLGVIFGGRSVEHEISVITGNQAITNVDTEKYEIVPIYISKKGQMYTGMKLLELKNYRDLDKLISECIQIVIVNDGQNINLVRYPAKTFGNNIVNTIDVALPCMHGTNGEDGTIEGYLNMLKVPYCGCDILSSAVGMDKIMMRRVMKQAGIPSLDFVAFYTNDYIKDEKKYLDECEKTLRYPVIVKPGNLGSSVGIKKAKDHDSLVEAIEYAMQFTDRIMVENAVTKLRELNCSVMGEPTNCTPSELEEPFGNDEILSYQDKYVSNGSKGGAKGDSKDQGMASLKRQLPANVSEKMKKEVQEMAVDVFKVLGCRGVVRIDFLVDGEKVYVNEINTIPGALSYYLWEATGVSFAEELDNMVNLALKRKRERESLTFSYSQNILALQGPKAGSKK